MKEAIRKDLNVRFKSLVEEGEMTISVAHTNNYGEADIFVTELKEMFPDIPFRFSDPLSLSVACHIGPGALAVGCTRIVK